MRLRAFVGLVLCSVVFFAGCARKERYGTIDTAAPAVQVKDVLLSEAYGGKAVRMSGKIAVQCASSGCWFFLDDGTGRMLVDLNRLGLGLPARGGKQALVSGTVTIDDQGQAVLSATGLEIS